LPARGENKMTDPLKRLRDAVTSRGREVEVGPDGAVREVKEPTAEESKLETGKPTKLAARTFGR
jgi:hypothetical protein